MTETHDTIFSWGTLPLLFFARKEGGELVERVEPPQLSRPVDMRFKSCCTATGRQSLSFGNLTLFFLEERKGESWWRELNSLGPLCRRVHDRSVTPAQLIAQLTCASGAIRGMARHAFLLGNLHFLAEHSSARSRKPLVCMILS